MNIIPLIMVHNISCRRHTGNSGISAFVAMYVTYCMSYWTCKCKYDVGKYLFLWLCSACRIRHANLMSGNANLMSGGKASRVCVLSRDAERVLGLRPVVNRCKFPCANYAEHTACRNVHPWHLLPTLPPSPSFTLCISP